MNKQMKNINYITLLLVCILNAQEHNNLTRKEYKVVNSYLDILKADEESSNDTIYIAKKLSYDLDAFNQYIDFLNDYKQKTEKCIYIKSKEECVFLNQNIENIVLKNNIISRIRKKYKKKEDLVKMIEIEKIKYNAIEIVEINDNKTNLLPKRIVKISNRITLSLPIFIKDKFAIFGINSIRGKKIIIMQKACGNWVISNSFKM